MGKEQMKQTCTWSYYFCHDSEHPMDTLLSIPVVAYAPKM